MWLAAKIRDHGLRSVINVKDSSKPICKEYKVIVKQVHNGTGPFIIFTLPRVVRRRIQSQDSQVLK